VKILKVESLVLKKKKEYERDEGEGDTREGLQIERCQHSWRPIKHVVRHSYWCHTVHRDVTKVYVYIRAPTSLTPYSEPKALGLLAPLTGSNYRISLHGVNS
jgi:hypothetical protein